MIGIKEVGLGLMLSVMAASLSTPGYAASPPPANAKGAMARQGGGRGGGRGMMGDNMAQELGLTAAQKAKMKAIQEDFHAKVEAANNPKLSPDQQREKRRSLGMAFREKMMAALTPAQRAKFQTMRPRMGQLGGRRGGNGFMALQEAAKKLHLSVDQNKKITVIMTSAQARGKSLREKMDAPGQDRTKMRQQMSDLRRDTLQKVQAVLTPQQREQVKAEMAKQRQARRMDQPGGGR